ERCEPPRRALHAVVRRVPTTTRSSPDLHGQLTRDRVSPPGRIREVPQVTGRIDEDLRRVAREEREGGPTRHLVGRFRAEVFDRLRGLALEAFLSLRRSLGEDPPGLLPEALPLFRSHLLDHLIDLTPPEEPRDSIDPPEGVRHHPDLRTPRAGVQETEDPD